MLILTSIIHSFINIFAGGRSNTKVIAFTLYSIVILAIYFFFRNKVIRSYKWKWFFILILITYIYGLFLHIFYAQSFGLNSTDFFITGNNGELSSSTLWHSHIAKGYIGQILNIFNISKLETIDAGGAYIGLIPSVLFYFGGLLLIIVLVQSLLYFVKFINTYLTQSSNREKIFLIIFYILVTFALIKTSIDGGIFNQSFIISFLVIAIFYMRGRGKDITVYYFLFTIVASILVLSSLYINSYTFGNGLNIAGIAALLSLYIVILYGSDTKYIPKYMIIFVILFIATWWVAADRDYMLYQYSATNINKGEKVLIYNEEQNEIINYTSEKNTTIHQLSKELDKNDTYIPISIPGTTCTSFGPSSEISASLITWTPILQDQFKKTTYINIQNSASIKKNDKWYSTLKIKADPCIPESLSIIDGIFKQSNINKYIIVNPLFYNATDTY